MASLCLMAYYVFVATITKVMILFRKVGSRMESINVNNTHIGWLFRFIPT